MAQQGNKKFNEIYKKTNRKIFKTNNFKKIGAIGQKKLLKSSVLIVGREVLGSPIAIYLAALGIGKIGILIKIILKYLILVAKLFFQQR